MKNGFITAALLLSAASAVASITGTISDPSGAPMSGVTVRAFSVETSRERSARLIAGTVDREPLASVQTDDKGAFRIDKPGAAVVDLVTTASGRELVTRATADGEDVSLVLHNVPARKLRVAAGGKGVGGAIVSLSRAVAVRTANDGTFDYPWTSPRVLGVYSKDIAPAEVNVSRTDTDVKVDSGVSLTGRVVGADDKPVSGATIFVHNVPLAKSGDDGSFAIPHAPRSWREVFAVAGDRIATASRSNATSYTLKLRNGAKITGTVRDERTRSGVAGMLIRLPFAEAITDANGAFTIAPAIPGRYFISTLHPLYATNTTSPNTIVVAPEGAKETIAATLLPLISGNVVDEDKKPVAAAFVGRTAPVPSPMSDATSTFTRRDGSFSFRGSVGGGFMRMPFDVSKEGYVDGDIAADNGQSKSGLTVVLHRGVPLDLKVIDTDRVPVVGSRIYITPSERTNGPMRREVRCGGADCLTTSGGTLSVKVNPGKYDLSVQGVNTVTKQLPGQNIDARTGLITITVDRGVDVAGRVTYSDGTPVGANVRVMLEATGSGMMSNAVEPDGTFVFHNAPRGAATLRPEIFDTTRFAGASKEITAPVSNVVLTLPRPAKVTGRVVDAGSGAAITDFELITQRAGQMFAGGAPRTIHSDDGSFTLDDVMPGRIEVSASSEGYSRGTASGIDVAEGAAVQNVELRLERAARVKGRVTSTEGQPLPGVRVASTEGPRRMMSPLDATYTDADGNYTLTTVSPGERNITFSKEGYVPTTKTVDASATKEAQLDASLDRGRELSGRVIDDSGQPVAAADIRAEGEPMRPVQTDTDGTFHLTGLREGHLRLIAHKNGYSDAREEADTTSGANNITLTLGRGATVTGHITGLSEAELGSAIVSYYGSGGYGNTRPDTAGNFTLTGVKDGKITIDASVGGPQSHRTARKIIEVSNGSAPAADIVFVAGATVRGRVIAPGRTVTDFNITFAPVDPQLAPGGGRIDGEGNYSVTGLGTGDYRITIMAPMGGGLIHNERFTVSGDTTHDIQLQALAIRGRVTDADGKPLPDVRIMADLVKREAGSPLPRAAMTDSEGRFVLDYLSATTWRISAQKEQYQATSRDVPVSENMGEVDLQLTTAAKSSVRVVDMRDGSPVFANVGAYQNGRVIYQTQTRASDGVADLYLAPGHYTISVGASHYARTTSQIDVPGPEVRVAIGHGGTVVVVAPAGSRVRLAGNGTGQMFSGSNRFESIPAGSYVVQLLGSDNKPVASKPVDVIEGGTVTVTLP